MQGFSAQPPGAFPGVRRDFGPGRGRHNPTPHSGFAPMQPSGFQAGFQLAAPGGNFATPGSNFASSGFQPQRPGERGRGRGARQRGRQSRDVDMSEETDQSQAMQSQEQPRGWASRPPGNSEPQRRWTREAPPAVGSTRVPSRLVRNAESPPSRHEESSPSRPARPNTSNRGEVSRRAEGFRGPGRRRGRGIRAIPSRKSPSPPPQESEEEISEPGEESDNEESNAESQSQDDEEKEASSEGAEVSSQGEANEEGEEEAGEEENSDRETELGLVREERDLREKALRQKRRLQIANAPKPAPTPRPKPPLRSAPVQPRSLPVTPSLQLPYLTTSPFELCLREEADRRQLTRALSVYEMAPGSDPLGTERPGYKAEWVVKEYTRSAAGLDQSGDVRRGPVLSRTLDYLFTNILDVDRSNPGKYTDPPHSSEHRFIDIYRFVSNRARAVTKDYKIAGETGTARYVQDLERIARFHILSEAEGLNYLLMEEESLRFEAALNFKRLENILISLEEAYRQVPGEHQNEAEFVAYKLLMRIENQRLVQKWIKDSGERLQAHPLLTLAQQAVRYYHTDNYCAFFSLLPQAPFLVAALLTLSFDKMRIQALRAMQQSYSDSDVIPLEAFQRWLGFNDLEETAEYLSFRGLEPENNGVRMKGVEMNEEKFVPSAAPRNVIEKLKGARWNVVHEAPILESSAAIQQKIPRPARPPRVVEPPKPIAPPTVTPKRVEIELPIIPSKPVRPIEISQPPKPADPPAPIRPAVVAAKPKPKPLPSNQFRFPVHDSDYLELADSHEEQAEMQITLRRYRKAVRSESQRQTEKCRLSILFYRFGHWKGIVEVKKARMAVEEEMTREVIRFRERITDQVIDDFLPKPDRTAPPQPKQTHNSQPLLEAMQAGGHSRFKASLLSFGVAPLDKLLDSTILRWLPALQQAGLYVNTDVENLVGSQVIFLLLRDGDLGSVDFVRLPPCALFILWVCDLPGLSEANLMETLDLNSSHFLTVDIMTVDPIYIEASPSLDTRLEDLILKPLSTLIRETEPTILEGLHLLKVREITAVYEATLEGLVFDLKQKLLKSGLAAGNYWVQVINAMHREVIAHLDEVYAAVFPSPEALSDLGVCDFSGTVKDYKPLRCVIDRLQLPLLPSARDFAYGREEAEAFLLDYAFQAVSLCEELLPGSSQAFLYQLQSVFSASPVQVVSAGLQVPWADFFLSVLTHQLTSLSYFDGKVYLRIPITVNHKDIVDEQMLEIESMNEIVKEHYHVDYYSPTRTLFPELTSSFHRTEQPVAAAAVRRTSPRPEKRPRPPSPPQLRVKPDIISELKRSKRQREGVQELLGKRSNL